MTFKKFFLTSPLKVVSALICLALSSMLTALASFALTWEVDALRNRSFSNFCWLLGLQLGCLLFKALTSYASTVLWQAAVQAYLHVCRQELVGHAFDYVQDQAAQLQNDLLKQLNIVATDYLVAYRRVISEVATIITTGAALLSFHYSLLILAALFAFVQIKLPDLFAGKLQVATNQVAQQNKSYLKSLADWLNGLSELRRYAAGEWFEQSLAKASSKLERKYVKQAGAYSVFDFFNQLAYSLADILLLLASAMLFIWQLVPFGLIASVGNFNRDFFGGLQYLADDLGRIKGTSKVREQLNEHMQRKTVRLATGAAPAAFAINNLQVQFANKQIISYPDFEIKPGEKVLLTGQNGSGKSTLFKLLLHELAPNAGTISYFDQTGAPIEPNFAQIGYLPQQPVLFPGTVKDNISLFDPEKIHDWESLTKQVALDADLATWPDGLATKFDLEKTNVSGGQRQKIALARSLAYQSQLILIDEGTSSIDQTAAEQIITKLLATDKTIILIAHQLRQEIKLQFDREINL